MTRHAILSGSGAEGWMHCPGKPRMTHGLPREDTQWSKLGTDAHAVMQRALSLNLDPHDFVGEAVDGVIVTPNMADAVAIGVTYCRRLMDTADAFWIEETVSLAKLDPPTEMFGTCDFAAYFRKRQELHVVDYKHGQGVYVVAKNNAQCRYYALAAALTFDIPVSTVVTTIIQPRFSGSADPIRSAIVDAVEMAEFAIELIACAHEAMKPNAPTVAGAWCRFCAAKNSCQTYQNFQHAETYREFKLAEPIVE